MTSLDRRHLLALGAAALAGSALPLHAQTGGKATLRIGYQKAANTLVLLKTKGTLEKRLQPLGVDVKWAEFAAGPQLLEALNVGSVDFGYVGEVPPVVAQAAGADFVYVAYELPSPEAEGILVPAHSPLKTLADLKGRKIAFNKGSDVHWLVVSALKKAGLAYSDFQPVYLAPADARAAFERGAIDAWAIWDPFQTAAQKQVGARRLTSAAGLVPRYQFFLAARSFAQAHGDVLKAVLEEAGREGQWIIANYGEAARQLSAVQGLDVDVIETALRNYKHVYKPIEPAVLADQQRIADAFHELRLIPKAIKVTDAL
ncbi:MAG: sulfonate ABC transporter substrate-binding protein [Comamonas sp.]